MAKSDRQMLSGILKKMLGERASSELLKQCDPELAKQLTPGMELPTVADLVAKKIIKLALDPEKAYQWAVEILFDRMEGKAAQGVPIKADSRVLENKLNDITTQHLNSIAVEFAKESAGQLADQREVTDESDGPAAKLLDLSNDGAGDPEEPPREPVMAGETAAEGIG